MGSKVLGCDITIKHEWETYVPMLHTGISLYGIVHVLSWVGLSFSPWRSWKQYLAVTGLTQVRSLVMSLAFSPEFISLDT